MESHSSNVNIKNHTLRLELKIFWKPHFIFPSLIGTADIDECALGIDNYASRVNGGSCTNNVGSLTFVRYGIIGLCIALKSGTTRSYPGNPALDKKAAVPTHQPGLGMTWPRVEMETYHHEADALSRGCQGSGVLESTPAGFYVFLDPDTEPEKTICEKL